MQGMEEEEPDTKYNSSEYLLVLPITHNGFNASQEDTGRGYQNMDTSRGYNNMDTGRRYIIWIQGGDTEYGEKKGRMQEYGYKKEGKMKRLKCPKKTKII